MRALGMLSGRWSSARHASFEGANVRPLRPRKESPHCHAADEHAGARADCRPDLRAMAHASRLSAAGPNLGASTGTPANAPMSAGHCVSGFRYAQPGVQEPYCGLDPPCVLTRGSYVLGSCHVDARISIGSSVAPDGPEGPEETCQTRTCHCGDTVLRAIHSLTAMRKVLECLDFLSRPSLITSSLPTADAPYSR